MACHRPNPDAARIQRWCDNRVPAPFRSRVRVGAEVADRRVTTSQSRPPWGGEGDWISTPVARFRCTRATGLWSLYWADRNSRFHEYDRFQPTRAVQGVLDVLDTCQDPILWG